MCGIITITMLAVGAQAHARELVTNHMGNAQVSIDNLDNAVDKLVDKVIDKLVSRISTSPRRVLRPLHPLSLSRSYSTVSTPGESVSPLAQTPFRREATLSHHVRPSVMASAGMPSPQGEGVDGSSATKLDRRTMIANLAAVAGPLLLSTEKAQAIQGESAGRIPGLSKSDVEGFQRYTRPAGKGGGHGVGWSEIIPYTFLVPEGWKETPVSIADLGGTELDLRFKANPADTATRGDLAVVLAPVLRFLDVGFNADVKIEDIGDPNKLINGFGPEIVGGPVEDLIVSENTRSVGGKTYYDFELENHILVSMTAAKNRVYIMSVRAENSNSWRNHQDEFRRSIDSFRVNVA